jgi:hypothetical protein
LFNDAVRCVLKNIVRPRQLAGAFWGFGSNETHGTLLICKFLRFVELIEHGHVIGVLEVG